MGVGVALSQARSMLDVALALHGEGWALVALQSGGKYPYAESAEAKRARTTWRWAPLREEARIREAWKRHPRANVGVVTGEASGLWGLDVDGWGGREALRTLIREHGPLTRTLVVATGRPGGLHYYWRLPPGVQLRNRVRFAPDLDTRGDGGLLVGPGSWHRESGRTYRIVVDAPLAEAPAWLTELVRGAAPAPVETPAGQPPAGALDGEGLDRLQRAALESAVRRVRSARAPADGEPGDRNNVLNAESFGLARTRAPRWVVEPALRAAALAAGLNEGAIARTFESAWSAGSRAAPLPRKFGRTRELVR